jgi:hypothetical protein
VLSFLDEFLTQLFGALFILVASAGDQQASDDEAIEQLGFAEGAFVWLQSFPASGQIGRVGGEGILELTSFDLQTFAPDENGVVEETCRRRRARRGGSTPGCDGHKEQEQKAKARRLLSHNPQR